MDYQYPFSYDWTTDEVIDVVGFFHAIERAHEKGIRKTELLAAYRRFKEIVPGKADEKKYCNEFEGVSGYSSYKTIQKMKKTDEDSIIKM
ncbi:UPF0223 family protein [Bacillus sp. FSL K6-3431]|uniref:UPF0223 family protein n=1 Tax=Bacillus sp. FSL K6-3431 TaxID=2921500 RepID=UPI0030FC54A9